MGFFMGKKSSSVSATTIHSLCLCVSSSLSFLVVPLGDSSYPASGLTHFQSFASICVAFLPQFNAMFANVKEKFWQNAKRNEWQP
jgi:hypothetical protein